MDRKRGGRELRIKDYRFCLNLRSAINRPNDPMPPSKTTPTQTRNPINKNASAHGMVAAINQSIQNFIGSPSPSQEPSPASAPRSPYRSDASTSTATTRR